MVKEVDVQKHILIGAVESGGWGVKMSNTYTNGIPDLLIVMPVGNGTPMIALEIKLLKALPIHDDDKVKFAHPLTELQHQCLMSIRRAGGHAGWLVVYTQRMTDYIFVGRDKRDVPTKAEFLAKCHQRKRGPSGQRWARVLGPTLVPLIRD